MSFDDHLTFGSNAACWMFTTFCRKDVHLITVLYPRLCTAFQSILQVLYPLLMVVMVSRTVILRVMSDALIEFRYFPSGYGNKCSWLSKVRKGWEEEGSLLSWANRGRWQTVETADETRRRKGNWFRIGFEPLFVDFIKSGTVFVVVSLFEVRALYLAVKVNGMCWICQ